MPKSKNRKDHKKKARARSLRISQDKKSIDGGLLEEEKIEMR